ncbi:MAG: hypothetical protein NZ518_00265 [Dehalococcoidia bacterium]|nr:hypothetical protein [Dehalococcoidia bacterium]
MQPLEYSRVAGTLEWLEQEARQSKAAIAKLQSQNEQIIKFIRDHVDQLRLAQDSLSTLRVQIGQVATLDEAVKLLQSAHAQTRESLAELSGAAERQRRGDQAEVERLRQLVAEVWQRAEALRRDLEPMTNRLQGFAEAQKRMIDQVQQTQNAQDVLKSEINAVALRLQGYTDREKKADERFLDLQQHLNALQKKDETLGDQYKILLERVVAAEQTMSGVIADQEKMRALDEQLHVLRVHLQRLDKQVVELSASLDQQAQSVEETRRLARQVDDRRAALAERLSEQGAAITQLRQELSELLADFETMEEQHRVRMVAELQQQIKDVRARVARARNR